MDKLRKIIEEHGDWSELQVYIERIETYVDSDFSLCFDNAKSLLESVGKEICFKNGKVLAANSKMNGVMKQTFSAMGFTNNDMVRQMSSSLATIGQQVGNLRNDITSAGHGRTVEEIKQRNNLVDIFTRDFLLSSIETVCAFLIQCHESKKEQISPEENEIIYPENEQEFNDFWDETYSEFVMGDYSYAASEILFNVDRQAYITEYKIFIETKE